MARVGHYDTKPEQAVRKLLHAMGHRFRLHRKDLPGKPDIVLPRHKKVVFVHGCFWHGHEGCRRAARPTTNIEFWNKKLDGNAARDARVLKELKELGWEPLVIWECWIRDVPALQKRLTVFMEAREKTRKTVSGTRG